MALSTRELSSFIYFAKFIQLIMIITRRGQHWKTRLRGEARRELFFSTGYRFWLNVPFGVDALFNKLALKPRPKGVNKWVVFNSFDCTRSCSTFFFFLPVFIKSNDLIIKCILLSAVNIGDSDFKVKIHGDLWTGDGGVSPLLHRFIIISCIMRRNSSWIATRYKVKF